MRPRTLGQMDRPADPGPARRSGKHGPAESRNAPRSAAPGTRSASRTARNAVRSAQTAVPWTIRSNSPGAADTGTTERAVAMDACGGNLGTCGGAANARVRQPAGEGRAPGRAATLTAPPPGVRASRRDRNHPARACDRGARPVTWPGTPGSEDRKARDRRGQPFTRRSAGWRFAEL